MSNLTPENIEKANVVADGIANKLELSYSTNVYDHLKPANLADQTITFRLSKSAVSATTVLDSAGKEIQFITEASLHCNPDLGVHELRLTILNPKIELVD